MKINIEEWAPALREKFNYSPVIEEVIVFLNTHLRCSECLAIKSDHAFHKGSSPARRYKHPVCKDCSSQMKNKKFNRLSAASEVDSTEIEDGEDIQTALEE